MSTLRVLLCRLGRHRWVTTVNPEVGGKDAVGEQCRHCRKDRPSYGQLPITIAHWGAG